MMIFIFPKINSRFFVVMMFKSSLRKEKKKKRYYRWFNSVNHGEDPHGWSKTIFGSENNGYDKLESLKFCHLKELVLGKKYHIII